MNFNFADALRAVAQPDQTIAITRAVAETINCPDWIRKVNRCDTPDECICRAAAEAVERVKL